MKHNNNNKKKSCFEAAVVRAPVFGPICADHYVHLLPLFYSHFAAREWHHHRPGW